MLITKKSAFTGKTHEREIPGLTLEMLAAWEAGALIQNVMPNISADDREFLISGSTPEEFDSIFGSED